MPVGQDFWDCFLNLEKRSDEAVARARDICSDFLGPDWESQNFKMEKMIGGYTNLVFKCTIPKGSSDMTEIIFRVQCSKNAMQLQTELIVFMKLAEHGLGPKLLGVFPGGRLEEYIPSRTVTSEECMEPKFSALIAQTLAKIHQIDMPLPKKSQMILTMRQWLEKIEKLGVDEFELWSKNAQVPKEKFPATINLESMRQEVDLIEKYLETTTSPSLFIHGDVYATNILLRDSCQEGENPIVIIDFEFGMYNYRGFDLAVHFNLLALTYCLSFPTCTEFAQKLTDKTIHKSFLEGYLQETYRLLKKDGKSFGSQDLSGVLERDVETLETEAMAFKGVLNFWWALWDIICDLEGKKFLDFHNAWRDRMTLYYYLKDF